MQSVTGWTSSSRMEYLITPCHCCTKIFRHKVSMGRKARAGVSLRGFVVNLPLCWHGNAIYRAVQRVQSTVKPVARALGLAYQAESAQSAHSTDSGDGARPNEYRQLSITGEGRVVLVSSETYHTELASPS